MKTSTMSSFNQILGISWPLVVTDISIY